MHISTSLWTWLAAALTIGVFSFLYKDNPFYRFVESLFVGVSAGYSVVIITANSFIPNLWNPLFKDGNWPYLVPMIFGLFYFAMLSKRFAYLTRIPFAFMIGGGAGLALPLAFQTNVIEQVKSTFLFNPGYYKSLGAFIDAAIIFIGVVSILLYFYFGRKRGTKLGLMPRIGVIFLMIGFGASFGYTVMARLALLIGRISFLLGDWLGIIR